MLKSARPVLHPAPGAVGPTSRLRRRYADVPAAALLTGRGVGEWPAGFILRVVHMPILRFDADLAARRLGQYGYLFGFVNRLTLIAGSPSARIFTYAQTATG